MYYEKIGRWEKVKIKLRLAFSQERGIKVNLEFSAFFRVVTNRISPLNFAIFAKSNESETRRIWHFQPLARFLQNVFCAYLPFTCILAKFRKLWVQGRQFKMSKFRR